MLLSDGERRCQMPNESKIGDRCQERASNRSETVFKHWENIIAKQVVVRGSSGQGSLRSGSTPCSYPAKPIKAGRDQYRADTQRLPPMKAVRLGQAFNELIVANPANDSQTESNCEDAEGESKHQLYHRLHSFLASLRDAF